MTSLSPSATALAGDLSRRRALRFLLLAIVATAVSVWLFRNVGDIWYRFVEPKPSAILDPKSVLFGLALAIAPIFAGVGWLVSFWSGVGSVYQPRSKTTPLTDRVLVGIGVFIWFLPSVALLASGIYALFTGSVSPPRAKMTYVLATDPIAFWQGVGFFFIVGGLCAWGAWQFWKGKLKKN